MKRNHVVFYICLTLCVFIYVISWIAYLRSVSVLEELGYTLDIQRQVNITNAVYLIITATACILGYLGSRKRKRILLWICVAWIGYQLAILINNLVASGLQAVSMGGSFYSGTMGRYWFILLHVIIIVLGFKIIVSVKNDEKS